VAESHETLYRGSIIRVLSELCFDSFQVSLFRCPNRRKRYMSAKIHLCFKRESLGPPYILLHVIPTYCCMSSLHIVACHPYIVACQHPYIVAWSPCGVCYFRLSERFLRFIRVPHKILNAPSTTAPKTRIIEHQLHTWLDDENTNTELLYYYLTFLLSWYGWYFGLQSSM